MSSSVRDRPADLVSPCCRRPLLERESSLRCGGCEQDYPLVGDVPVLINDDNSVFRRDDVSRPGPREFDPSTGRSTLVARLAAALPKQSANYSGDELVERFRRGLAASAADPKRVLVLGGGIAGRGIADLAAAPGVTLVESDIFVGPRNTLVFDAHDIPFPDGSFDAVIAQAVLEHVIDPFRCVGEMSRVLKSDGLVYASTSFMQQVHGGDHDFMRFTLAGHRYLFRGFDAIDTGVAVGPGSALSWTWSYFLASFATNRRQRRAARLAGLLTSFFWKYFDKRLHTRPFAGDAASSVYFLGRRLPDGRVLSAREVVDSSTRPRG